jgi:YD repeat-containing protein
VRGPTTYPRVEFSYDFAGRVTAISYKYQASDPSNRAWTLAYDGSGRVSTMTGPGPRVTTFHWTSYTRASDGQVLPLLTSITRPRGNTPWSVQYAGSGRVWKVTDVNSNVTTLGYSSLPGQSGSATLTDARQNVSAWSFVWPNADLGYTPHGYRVTNTTDAMGRSSSYQALAGGNLVTRVTDFRGRVTSLTWDHSKGNLTSVTRPTPSGQGAVWSYSYDPTFSQMTAAADPLDRLTLFSLN